MITVLAFALPLLIALLLGRPVISWYKKKHWLDDPKKNAHPKVIHTMPLPRGGGLVVGIAIFIAIFLFIPLTAKILGILVATTILIFVGIWDDIANPHPFVRLGLLTIAAAITMFSGISIPFVTNPFGGIISFEHIPFIASMLGIAWIVWSMNIVNFSTGLDGQMPGFVVIAAITIAILSQRFFPDPEQLTVFHLALIVAGAYLGFLFWNLYPQKMMSGFGASTIAGFFLAVLSIFSQAKLATAILVLAIPMSDAIYVIMRRILHKKSPFWGDRSHLHHALLDLGLSKRQVAYVYWASTFVLGVLALNLKSNQKSFAILLIVATVCIIGTWLRWATTSFGKSVRDNG